MPHQSARRDRLVTSARWPLGVLVTSWAYLWRTTPIHRRELPGSCEDDGPPAIDGSADLADAQLPRHGVGTFLRRRYRADIVGARASAAEAMEEIQRDPNVVAPGTLTHFEKTSGDRHVLQPGDEFTIRMPGPWDGPVRVVERTLTSFRFVTLSGHIEAGQIEWRAAGDDGWLRFEVESWSRPGDRLSHVMHHRLRMAKEVQLHMWTSVLERVIRRYGGCRAGPLDIDSHRIELPADG